MTEKTASPLHRGETAKFFFTVMQAAERKIMNCQTAKGEAWLDAVKRHEPEILSAKLADIGEPDTPAGRELIKGIYENKRKNSPNTYDWIYD